jgi:hypothetical protein
MEGSSIFSAEKSGEVMTQAFNLLKGEGGRQKHWVKNIWGEMIESRVIIEYNTIMFPCRGEFPQFATAN